METLTTRSAVSAIPAADSASAFAHFSAGFGYETDCWDVHAALSSNAADFVLLDVRSPEAYAHGHVGGAINLPNRKIDQDHIAKWSGETLFVVYCAGPHCNGAQRAALRLAGLKRPVKLMIGGVAGWLDEGFSLIKTPLPQG